jgi:hypothetical protein
MSAAIVRGRHTGALEGDFVVFLIGMRVNKPWQVRRWLQVYRAMAPMIRALEERPERGLLGWERAFIGGPAIVQYWRSFEDLERFARDPGERHLPAWKRYNREVRDSAAVGIWHETYKVGAGDYEAIYGNMPVFGLAAAGGHAPVRRTSESAALRIGARAAPVR